VYDGCDRSQPTKAVTGHRTPKSGVNPRLIYLNI
jgi:hypothetical protein